MPTILLQEIRDLLFKFFGWLADNLDHQTETLDQIADDTDDIKGSTDNIDTNTSVLPDIDINIGAIKSNTDQIINIKNKLDSIDQDLTAISLAVPSINVNTSATASYCDDIATNTLNIYNKITTISEDTTQMRADNQVIIGLLTDLLTEMRGTQT